MLGSTWCYFTCQKLIRVENEMDSVLLLGKRNPRICEFVEIEMCMCDAAAGYPVHSGGRSAAPQPSQGLVLKVFVVVSVTPKGFRNVPVNGEGALILTAFPIVSFPWNSLLTSASKGGTPENSFPPELKHFPPSIYSVSQSTLHNCFLGSASLF